MTNEMDNRLKLISNSSMSLLHTCPRKYQLTKTQPDIERDATVHTEFGKVFGEGVQRLLAGDSLEDAWIKASMQWTIGLHETDRKKSFWYALAAVEKFSVLRETTGLAEYEVATINGKQACELSFRIDFGDGFYYRGYVDVVLRHKLTGMLLVVDCKTTGSKTSTIDKYRHSGQAIGYSVVLDEIEPELSSYEVMYFEFLTELNKFEEHVIMCSALDRAKWIRDICTDIDIMKLYAQYCDWPKHGESCTSYNRSCQFIDICSLRTLVASLDNQPSSLEYDGKEYTVETSVDRLIDIQMSR